VLICMDLYFRRLPPPSPLPRPNAYCQRPIFKISPLIPLRCCTSEIVELNQRRCFRHFSLILTSELITYSSVSIISIVALNDMIMLRLLHDTRIVLCLNSTKASGYHCPSYAGMQNNLTSYCYQGLCCERGQKRVIERQCFWVFYRNAQA
jgi:hypothetical protein